MGWKGFIGWGEQDAAVLQDIPFHRSVVIWVLLPPLENLFFLFFLLFLFSLAFRRRSRFFFLLHLVSLLSFLGSRGGRFFLDGFDAILDVRLLRDRFVVIRRIIDAALAFGLSRLSIPVRPLDHESLVIIGGGLGGIGILFHLLLGRFTVGGTRFTGTAFPVRLSGYRFGRLCG